MIIGRQKAAPGRRAVMGLALVGLLLLPLRKAEAARRPDPGVATLLSVASTLLPIATGTLLLAAGNGSSENSRLAVGLTSIAIGSAIGPSVGTLYARGQDAWATLLLRTASTGLMMTGLAIRYRGDPDNQDLGLALTVAGAVPTGVLAIYDVANAGRLAKETRRQSGYAALFRGSGPWGLIRRAPPPLPAPLQPPSLEWTPPPPARLAPALRRPDAG